MANYFKNHKSKTIANVYFLIVSVGQEIGWFCLRASLEVVVIGRASSLKGLTGAGDLFQRHLLDRFGEGSLAAAWRPPCLSV